MCMSKYCRNYTCSHPLQVAQKSSGQTNYSLNAPFSCHLCVKRTNNEVEALPKVLYHADYQVWLPASISDKIP